MLTYQKDAYGEMVSAYYNGNDAIEIVERDNGFISTSVGPNEYFWEFEL